MNGRNPHHFETMGHHCLLVPAGESSFQGFSGGAGFRPSTVPDKLQLIRWLTNSRCGVSTPAPANSEAAKPLATLRLGHSSPWGCWLPERGIGPSEAPEGSHFRFPAIKVVGPVLGGGWGWPLTTRGRVLRFEQPSFGSSSVLEPPKIQSAGSHGPKSGFWSSNPRTPRPSRGS